MTLKKKSERETESRGGCQNVLLKKKGGESHYGSRRCMPMLTSHLRKCQSNEVILAWHPRDLRDLVNHSIYCLYF